MKRAVSAVSSALLAAALLGGPLSGLAAAEETTPYSAGTEARNYSKISERRADYQTPAYQAQAKQVEASDAAELALILSRDPERNPATLCATGTDGCSGDTRFAAWAATVPGAVQQKVTFTARSGATLSGRVWAVQDGSSKPKPGVVIVNGSVQAPESLYWFAAATLARAGYVVLTYDPQGQGRSDVRGAAPDENEGVPAQAGVPFFDGPGDALSFFVSTPAARYDPRPSRGGTDHSDKQIRRVASGLDSAFNPLWAMVDPTRLGFAGHSFGASGISYVGQQDPRIDAIVAWDNLAVPAAGGLGEGTVPVITKPALGMSADYFLTPTPYTSAPGPTSKSGASLAYSTAGVDTGQVIIRGGTHYEFSYLPDPAFGATLRGVDMVDWYTLAWFDKYLRHDPTADARLLTDRWRHDAREAAVDPTADGNLYSGYLQSRMDIRTTATGTRVTCEDLRHADTACAGVLSPDGGPKFSSLAAGLGDPTLPPPVVPEAPLAVLLPLLTVVGAGTWLARRRRALA